MIMSTAMAISGCCAGCGASMDKAWSGTGIGTAPNGAVGELRMRSGDADPAASSPSPWRAWGWSHRSPSATQ